MTNSGQKSREEILREAHNWYVLMEESDASEVDRKAFINWLSADPLHRDMYDSAITFFSALGELSNEDLDVDITRQVPRECDEPFKPGILASLFTKKGFSASAAITAIASVFLVFIIISNQSKKPTDVLTLEIATSYQTAIGETQIITMQDGSIVTLGAASALETTYTESKRGVAITRGTAFFDVVNDASRPFLVEAGELEAHVHGTTFEVSYNISSVRVAVADGTVEVRYPYIVNQQQTGLIGSENLTAGYKVAATVSGGLGSVEKVNISTIGSWREDKLFYDGSPLSELIADANRYSESQVIIDGDVPVISNFKVRGSFNARDIDGMLSTLSEIYPVEIDRSDPDVIRIRIRIRMRK
ncbi:MAG: FecR domain-containing protein [Pseudomonadota bacterium]